MTKRIAFTDSRLEKLEFVADPEKPKQDRSYLWDEKQPGLAICITSGGAKVFYLVKKINGKVERIRLEAFPDISVDQARTLAQEQIGKIAGGQNPAEIRRISKGEQTLEEVFARFITDYATPHKRTWEDDQGQFDRHCAPLKSRRLSTIHMRDIQRLHNEIGKTAPYAANRALALLSSVFSFARTIGYEGLNPCRGVKRFKEQSRARFLQPDEMPRLIKALNKYPDQSIADFFRLALYTGARRSNVQSAAWADINFGRRCWSIPAAQSKSGKPINVPLTDQALEVLQRRWKERTEGQLYVFPSHSASGHLTEPKAAWKTILAAAKIDDLRLHDLRRTFGSWMTAAGAPAAIVAEALGQTTTHVTHVYTRVNLASVTGAVNLATSAMSKAGRARGKQQQKATA